MSVWMNFVMLDLLVANLTPTQKGIYAMLGLFQGKMRYFTKEEAVKHIGKKLHKHWDVLEPLLTRLEPDMFIVPWIYIDDKEDVKPSEN